ncbi:MAG: hypothetical protein ACXWLI_11555 [Myxococcaceae bacterium]
MSPRRLTPVSALVLVLGSAVSGAREPSEEEAAPAAWAYRASLAFYGVPSQTNFLQPVMKADHGPVHLEARYNYESLSTASFFLGWNFAFGDTVSFTLTPIAGCMVGDAGGPIVGLELSLGWGPLSFSSEGEWVFDLQGGTDGFVYVWSELDVSPWEWFRVGMALQRTRVFHNPREVVVGPLVGVSVWKVSLSPYWFQPGGADQSCVLAAGVSF